jgi:hypothetical protein
MYNARMHARLSLRVRSSYDDLPENDERRMASE